MRLGTKTLKSGRMFTIREDPHNFCNNGDPLYRYDIEDSAGDLEAFGSALDTPEEAAECAVIFDLTKEEAEEVRALIKRTNI